VKQQNELLEREKALKQSEIDVHKARIERLESLQAPAIARDLEQMTRTADQFAQRKQDLEKQVESLTAAQSEEARKVADKAYLLGLENAGIEALTLLDRSKDFALANLAALKRGHSPELDYFVDDILNSYAYFRDLVEQATSGKRPILNAFEVWLGFHDSYFGSKKKE
jgi:hypothetical protein